MHDETLTTAGQRNEPAHRTRNMTETPEERSRRLNTAVDSHSPSTHSQNNSVFFPLGPCLHDSLFCIIFSSFPHVFHFYFKFSSELGQPSLVRMLLWATFQHATILFWGISRQWTKQSPLPQLAFYPLCTLCSIRKKEKCFHIPESILDRLL